ncbi:S1C family serine protease [Paenibacillus sp. GCM10023252]|uniref:S1C family serine protease n=1 Tax=Paenibacillus sp. GCM10023252 TaxID=3252649 RepID=UPI00361C5908
MTKSTWLSIIACGAVLLGGTGGALAIRSELPKKLSTPPLLAVSEDKKQTDKPKTLKDIIFETQKLVVMIETEDGKQGSGFLYNGEGDLITNAHVVTGVKEVKIKTADARELQGQVIGISTETDVAVVRVPDLADLDPLPLVRDEKTEVGDEVLSVGSPLGFQNTVTTGIISGVNRTFDIEPYHYTDLYQISAAIAPGNSGGPLVDKTTGRVIGINSAGIEQSGIGFSIPIVNILAMAEAWSTEPMEVLPEAVQMEGSEEAEVEEEKSISEYADYLVRHFYDSLNNSDYVYAYSLIGGNWREGTSYDEFREGYLPTRNVVIDDLLIKTEGEDKAVVTAVISVDERVDGEYKLSKYQVTYIVGYENDQLKLISGKGKKIEQ